MICERKIKQKIPKIIDLLFKQTKLWRNSSGGRPAGLYTLVKPKVMGRVLHAFWLKEGGGGILNSRRGISIFLTNNMIFLECGVIALFEAFYMFRDYTHVKIKFGDVK